MCTFQPEHVPELIPQIQQELTESRDFINVLSSPSNLKKIVQTDIPGLRGDITLRGYQLEGITWLT